MGSRCRFGGNRRCWEAGGGFIRDESSLLLPSFCLFFSDVGCGARGLRPELVPLQGSSLNFIYIRDANHRADTLARMKTVPVNSGQRSVRSTPVLAATGLLKMILKELLVGILKHCCCAKMGAACLITYQTPKLHITAWSAL